jgi:tRNA1Val (adenine37-N6)-methyltransferase
MANQYFKFKEFTVYQDMCAMKVCTDACLFGAYTAAILQNNNTALQNCLDIGTGTGLLSLMLAQKTSVEADAIEIDKAAFEQASRNFYHSPWKHRLKAFNTNAINFTLGKQYQYIISNPPFFEGDLKSSNDQKNAAKHDSTLTHQQLLHTASQLLLPGGTFAVLLPYKRVKNFIEIAEANGLYLVHKALVKQTPLHSFFRGMLYFTNQPSAASKKEICIKDEMGDYTKRFTELLYDYYLYL